MGAHKYYNDIVCKWEDKKVDNASIDNLHTQKKLIYSYPHSYTIVDSESGETLISTEDKEIALSHFLKIS
ncbi:MAG: hypothetical protein ACUZ8O_17390 [Candidatus Anammoxibacter sp.]